MLVVVATVVAPAVAADQAKDVAEIRAVQMRQQDAWNQHAAKAYANLFIQEGDVVNVVGWCWKGRSEIEGKLNDALAFVFNASTLTVTETDDRFLTTTIAVAHAHWTTV